MRLTGRFFAMNAAAVVISLFITALAAIVFAALYTKLVGPRGSAEELQRILETRAGMAALRAEAEAMEFEQLLEPQHQEWLGERVRALGAEAVILRDRMPLYATSPLDAVTIEEALIYSGGQSTVDTLDLGGVTHMIARVDYGLPSGRHGVVLLLAPVRLQTGYYVVLGVFLAVVFALSFLLANYFVSRRFSRGIIAPVVRLKEAAVNIGNGELDFGIAEEGEGEVRELCRMLELMRIKLKESVYWQEKYDENRRFLVSSISHDLKTPVTSIIGYLDGILDGVASTPQKQKEYVETARSKALLVNAMIDDLLLYSRLDMNQVPFHLEPTDVRAFFEDCMADVSYMFSRRGVALTLAVEFEEPVYVRMDRERFQRVIQNILDNCLKYMDKEDGRVDVLLRKTRTSAIMEIRDNGRGIPESEVPRIFDRFYRVDPSRSRTGGTGLGLAIARQIVEGHDGRIWARSAEGEGMSVIISLPIHAGPVSNSS